MSDPSDTSTPEDYQQLFDESVLLLSSVRGTLADLLKGLVQGKTVNLRDVVAKQAELEAALRRAFETEQKFHDWKSKHGRSGGADAAEIDFDAARYEIGCRLSRLRACCHSE